MLIEQHKESADNTVHVSKSIKNRTKENSKKCGPLQTTIRRLSNIYLSLTFFSILSFLMFIDHILPLLFLENQSETLITGVSLLFIVVLY